MGNKPLSFREAVAKVLTSKEREKMIYSFDVLGDMALMEIPKELQKKKKVISRTFLDTHPSIHKVFEKVGEHSGKYRVEKIQWLAGDKTPEVVYMEWGCQFHVHPGKVFFNPRLGTERQRVAQMIRPRQTAAVFFSGVAPYAVILAKHTPVKRVYALEWNPEARMYAELNIHVNKVDSRVVPIWGDVDAAPVLEPVDHVIMPAPESALAHLPAAVSWTKIKGIIHLYLFVDTATAEQDVRALLEEKMPAGVKWKQVFARKVSDFSPRKQQWCVGIQVLSKPKVSIKKSKKKKKA